MAGAAAWRAAGTEEDAVAGGGVAGTARGVGGCSAAGFLAATVAGLAAVAAGAAGAGACGLAGGVACFTAGAGGPAGFAAAGGGACLAAGAGAEGGFGDGGLADRCFSPASNGAAGAAVVACFSGAAGLALLPPGASLRRGTDCTLAAAWGFGAVRAAGLAAALGCAFAVGFGAGFATLALAMLRGFAGGGALPRFGLAGVARRAVTTCLAFAAGLAGLRAFALRLAEVLARAGAFIARRLLSPGPAGTAPRHRYSPTASRLATTGRHGIPAADPGRLPPRFRHLLETIAEMRRAVTPGDIPVREYNVKVSQAPR